MNNIIKVKKLIKDAKLPKKGREGDACYDLWTSEDVEVRGYETIAIPTGIAIELPTDYEAEVRPRSGISLKGVEGVWSGIKNNFVCSVIQGTIDSNYRGEIKIIFRNEDLFDFTIPKHTKLAQMKINKVYDMQMVEVEELSDSVRGNQGFGSSGN